MNKEITNSSSSVYVDNKKKIKGKYLEKLLKVLMVSYHLKYLLRTL